MRVRNLGETFSFIVRGENTLHWEVCKMEKSLRRNEIQEEVTSASLHRTIQFNGNRRAIFNYIRKNPGAHYSRIRRETGLSAGVITYHTRELERKGLIKSHCGKYLKRFYPYGITIDCEPLTVKQREVVEVISRRARISTNEIARELGKTRQAVIYHLKNLADLGVVRSKMNNRKMLWYTVDR